MNCLVIFYFAIQTVEAGPGASWISERHLKTSHKLKSHKIQKLYFQHATRRITLDWPTINRLLQNPDHDHDSTLPEKLETKRLIKIKETSRLRRFFNYIQ